MNTIITKYDSPIGTLYISVTDKIDAVSTTKPKGEFSFGTSSLASKVIKFLDDYFKGFNPESKDLFKLLNIDQGTPFQKKVWKKLMGINFGKTTSYGNIAQKLGNPNSSRAVGAAVGKNPFLVIVPCHRVVGSNNQLTGFSAGLPKKVKLLKHEGLELN